MDHKAWPWKKKSSEKTIVETDSNNLSLNVNEEEIQKLLVDKAELENHLKKLTDKLSSALAECNAKDDILKKHENTAQEALAGWEKTKGEAASLKRKLDEATTERVVLEERLIHLDAALKECMQQLRFVREEQEHRIHDALTKTSKEYEKDVMSLEEKLAETSKRLAEADAENTHLSKALFARKNVIEDLNRQRNQAEADFSALMNRLESKEKDNASLKYEARILERELEIRNEEREFNRRTAEASHRQHLENAKKIAKLESECQRLRLLVRKRLPGPAALAKMRHEVEILGRDSVDMRRSKLNTSPNGMMIEPERINNLMEQLCLLEEEHRTLKEALNKKINELQFSRNMYSRTASKLLEVESQLEESSIKGQTNMEPSRSSNVSHEVSLPSISDIDNGDKVSCADSRASALISELENFKNKKQKSSISLKNHGALGMNLMNDFVEMEKLAVFSVDNPSGNSPLSSGEANTFVGPVEMSNGNSLEVMGKEIIPVSDCRSNFGEFNPETKAESIDLPYWLQDIMKVISEHKHFAQRNPDEILQDIKQALSSINHSNSSQFVDMRKGSHHHEALYPSHIKSYNSLKPSESSILVDIPRGEMNEDTTFSETSKQNLQSDLSKSICKITELIEEISLQTQAYGIPEMSSSKDERYLPHKNSETHSGYTVRVLQWKTSELSYVLQQFLHACYDLLNGKADINGFAHELSSALDWIVNHCFSLQDVSSMREEIKKQFDWEESRSESEAEVGIFGQASEADKFHLPKERFSSLSMVVTSNGHVNLSQMEEVQSKLKEEDTKLRDELSNKEIAEKDAKGICSGTEKVTFTVDQQQDSDKSIASSQKEEETFEKSMAVVEEEVDIHELVSKNLDEAPRRSSSIEAKLENSRCKESKLAHLELQHQLESVSKQEVTKNELKLEEKQPIRTELEITAASEKLAECQETILHLRKRLDALSNSKEASLSDKVISTREKKSNIANVPHKSKLTTQRSSLLDQMMAEDDTEGPNDPKSPNGKKGKEVNISSSFITNETIEALEQILLSDTSKGREANSFAIVPRKKEGVKGLWKKLFLRKKRGNSKKLPLPFTS